MAAVDSIGCLVQIQSYRPIDFSETGKITRGTDKKLVVKGFSSLKARLLSVTASDCVSLVGETSKNRPLY